MPASKLSVRVQRAEKLSLGNPAAGAPASPVKVKFGIIADDTGRAGQVGIGIILAAPIWEVL